jgi:hypothetical protein
MANAPNPDPPLAEAARWTGRIFAASLVMVGPGLGGMWLDRKFHTGWIGIVGFAAGLACGMYFLILMTQQVTNRRISDQELEDREPEDRSSADKES